jgi:hypothetical protein
MALSSFRSRSFRARTFIPIWGGDSGVIPPSLPLASGIAASGNRAGFSERDYYPPSQVEKNRLRIRRQNEAIILLSLFQK